MRIPGFTAEVSLCKTKRGIICLDQFELADEREMKSFLRDFPLGMTLKRLKIYLALAM